MYNSYSEVGNVSVNVANVYCRLKKKKIIINIKYGEDLKILFEE